MGRWITRGALREKWWHTHDPDCSDAPALRPTRCDCITRRRESAPHQHANQHANQHESERKASSDLRQAAARQRRRQPQPQPQPQPQQQQQRQQQQQVAARHRPEADRPVLCIVVVDNIDQLGRAAPNLKR